MAAAGARTDRTGNETKRDPKDLEAEVARLREDIATLAEQLQKTGKHAREAAAEGVDVLRSQGEAAIDGLRANAKDVEAQLAATVREKPVTSLAIAAGIGFLFAIISRR